MHLPYKVPLKIIIGDSLDVLEADEYVLVVGDTYERIDPYVESPMKGYFNIGSSAAYSMAAARDS